MDHHIIVAKEHNGAMSQYHIEECLNKYVVQTDPHKSNKSCKWSSGTA